MATNPNDAVGTSGAYGGRVSVNARGDVLSAFTGRGVLSGWAASPASGMAVAIGGVSGVRDVAIAEDSNGNKTTVNNISEAPITVSLAAAPAANSRIDAIVAYVDNPPQGEATVLDNPSACGLIAVSGTTAGSPSVPSESTIRSAITADGASGSTAYYVVLATVTVASGTTDVTANMITAGSLAVTQNVDSAALTETYGTEIQNFATSNVYATRGSYQVQSAGRYLVLGNLVTNSVSAGFVAYTRILKNGEVEAMRYRTIGANSYGLVSCQALVECAAGDTITGDLQTSVAVAASANTRYGFIVVKVAPAS